MDEIQFAREQQTRQIENDPQALYADSIREEKATNILAQINPDNLLTDIEHRIRGEKKDIYSGQWSKISTKGNNISEDLVSNFVSFLGCILNQNTSMSHLTEAEINNLMGLISDWVRRDLEVNAEKYEIEGQYTEYDRIGHIICASCFFVFKRALRGAEAARIFKMMKVSETVGAEKRNKLQDLKFW